MDKFGITLGLKIDLKNEKDEKKLYPIYVYIGQGQKRRYINTRIKCRLRNFNGKSVFATPTAVRDNAYIDDVVEDVKRQIYTVIAKHNDFNFDLFDKEQQLNQFTSEKKGLNDNFLMFFSNVAYGYKGKTQELYFCVLNMVRKYKRIQRFKDITRTNIKEFDSFLEEQGLKNSTIVIYHSKLHRVISKAIEDGYKLDDPYTHRKSRKVERGNIKYIEETDLQKIISYKPRYKNQQWIRDLFILQAFTGLAFVDAIKISKDKIKEIQGKKYIVDKREKTNQEYSIRLYPEAINILEKYNYNLSEVQYRTYNNGLKRMAKIVGVREDLSSHMARHTFATIALNRGVPLAIVAKMLGHSSTQCTEIYAQYLQSTIQREGYDKLEDVFG